MTLFRHRRRSDRDRYRIAGARAASLSGGGGGLMAPTRAHDGSAPQSQRIDAARQGTLFQHQLRQQDDRHRWAGKQHEQAQQHGDERHRLAVAQGRAGLRMKGQGYRQTADRHRRDQYWDEQKRQEWEGYGQGYGLRAIGRKQREAQVGSLRHQQWQQEQEREEFERTAGLRDMQHETAERISQTQHLLTRAENVRRDPDGGMTITVDSEEHKVPAGTVQAMGMQAPDTREAHMQNVERKRSVQELGTQAAQIAIDRGISLNEAIRELGVAPAMGTDIRRQAEKIIAQQKGAMDDRRGNMLTRRFSSRRRRAQRQFVSLRDAATRSNIDPEAVRTRQKIEQEIRADVEDIRNNPTSEEAKLRIERVLENQERPPALRDLELNELYRRLVEDPDINLDLYRR